MRIRVALGALLILAFLLCCGMRTAESVITVYKDPTCTCCQGWIDHLKANGFEVTVQETSNLSEYHSKYEVPAKLETCHIAVVDGYVIEGHVPAAEIQRLLKERPKAKGLVVPGMPMGAPGMDSPHAPAYSVLLFDADGHTSVYKQYPAH